MLKTGDGQPITDSMTVYDLYAVPLEVCDSNSDGYVQIVDYNGDAYFLEPHQVFSDAVAAAKAGIEEAEKQLAEEQAKPDPSQDRLDLLRWKVKDAIRRHETVSGLKAGETK